jgi:hypothetical protein
LWNELLLALIAFEAGAAALDVKKVGDVDLSGEEWNARMTAEGLATCLKAEAAAKGLFRTNAII